MSVSFDSAAGGDRSVSVDSFIQEAVGRVCDPAVVANPFATLQIGELLSGRFVIEEFSRRGGMSRLYKSRDSQTGEAVAIKVMDRLGRNCVNRFTREATVLAQLVHPGIVRYIAHGSTTQGTLYLAMEWLHGEDLCERLARGRLPIDDALNLARRACEALALAHRSDVVHRDIKPSNLFLQGGNVTAIKILDFGIARLCEEAHALTGAGTMLGTVGYMAPEQVRAEQKVDRRADVFALGCVLYECLTGRAPFVSQHPLAVLAKVLHEEPEPIRELRPEVSKRLDALIRRMLAKSPADRPRDAGVVLEEFASEEMLRSRLDQDWPEDAAS